LSAERDENILQITVIVITTKVSSDRQVLRSWSMPGYHKQLGL